VLAIDARITMNMLSTTRDWSWTPDKSGWFRQILQKIKAWESDPSLEFDDTPLRTTLEQAAENHDPWLTHPCASVLTSSKDAKTPVRDLQLAVWTAANTSRSLGKFVLPEPAWVWTPGGGIEVAPGCHDLEEVAQRVTSSDWPASVALDAWCHSIGFALDASWAEAGFNSAEEEAGFQRNVVDFLHAMNWADSIRPAVGAWLTSVTKVAIPLRWDGKAGSMFRSGGMAQIPGMVALDLGGEVQILEALVHESAHHHLYIAETDAPLIATGCEQRFRSPLRPEPRPLRGIMLAYHALAYICLFYEEATNSGLATPAGTLSQLQSQLEDAEATLLANRHLLTPAGTEFLERTLEVAHHVSP
jgi:HEXXH motif-containing protein